MIIFVVEVSAQAEIDLRSIFGYIAIELQSPETAHQQLDRLEEKIISLEQMPQRCRRYDKEPWHSRGMRFLPVDNYIVFYICNSKKKIVTVIRVMYSGGDIDKQLT